MSDVDPRHRHHLDIATGAREGRRVRLIHHTDEYSPLQPGTLGTVRFIDTIGTIHVDWDDGSTLGLIPGVDRWEWADAPA